jgi:hypothetical protein
MEDSAAHKGFERFLESLCSGQRRAGQFDFLPPSLKRLAVNLIEEQEYMKYQAGA